MPDDQQVPLDVGWKVVTPERHIFTYRPAGFILRGCAWFLDLVVKSIVIIALSIVLSATVFLDGGEMMVGILLIVYFVITWFYGAVLETFWRGQTIGKKAFGLRVVSQQGGPASGPACVIRNFLRAADMFPLFYLTGFVCSFFSSGFRRLGDLAAGTLVVYVEKPPAALRRPQLSKPILELASDLPTGLSLILSLDMKRALTAYVDRRQRLHSHRRMSIAKRLKGPLEDICHINPVPDYEADHLLCAVHLCACFPQLDVQEAWIQAKEALFLTGGEVLTPQEEARIWQDCARDDLTKKAGLQMYKKPDHWREAETMADQSRLTPKMVLRQSELTRDIGADLALAEAYHMPDNVQEYLSRLVADMHHRYYRSSSRWLKSFIRLVFVRTPEILYGDPFLKLSFVMFFGLFALSIVSGIINPDLPVSVLGEQAISDMEMMYSESLERADAGQSMAMTGFYISHNIGIALNCFATGIFAGIGSMITILFNAFALGMVFAHLSTASPPIDAHFLEFVIAHGPFELMGIVMSGAAGMCMGWGLISTDGLTRMASLRRSALRCIPIVGTASVFIGIAAFIEAIISPSALPIWIKISVAVLSTLLIVFYLTGIGYIQKRKGSRQ